MEPLKIMLALCGAPENCTCAVELTEAGEIVLPTLAACLFTRWAHAAAIRRAMEILEEVRAKGSKL